MAKRPSQLNELASLVGSDVLVVEVDPAGTPDVGYMQATNLASSLLGLSDTDALAEGASNLYYTDVRASAAAPVQSVNGFTGAVTVSVPVDSVNGQTGVVSLGAADVGALPDTYTAPVQSVNSQTGTVSLTASDVGAAATGHTHVAADVTDLGNAATRSYTVSTGSPSGGSDGDVHYQV